MYVLHLYIEVMSKVIVYFNMTEIFKIIPVETVTVLEEKLRVLFQAQQDLDKCESDMIRDATIIAFKSSVTK